MKRLFFGLLCLCLLLCGCSAEGTEEAAQTPKVESEVRLAAAKSVLGLLTEAYWQYEKESQTYTLTEFKKDDLPQSAQEAVERGGYTLPKEGTDCLLVTAALTHYNETAAGTAQIYLSEDGTSVLAAYYAPAEGAYAACTLAERNLYLEETFPQKTETDGVGSFRSLPANLHGRSVAAVQGGRICLLEGGEVLLYTLTEAGFVQTAAHTPKTDSPMSAAFLADGTLAVLFGAPTNAGQEGSRVVSTEVRFFDETLKETKAPFSLDGADCSLVASHGEEMLLYGGTTLRTFVPEGEGFTQKLRRSLGHTAKALTVCDMDGDGEDEYFITDGGDCCLYRRQETGFVLLWRTHLGTDWYNGPLSAGDTNGDGAAEVYLCDDNATAIRYVLGERGIVSQNEDITRGDARFAADFNGDGRTDYLQMDSEDNTTLYLAE